MSDIDTSHGHGASKAGFGRHPALPVVDVQRAFMQAAFALRGRNS